jgi:hypothetical protein
MRAARVLLVAALSVVVAAASASCTGERVRGSGKVVTKDVAVSSFTRLQVSWGFEVTAAVGQPSLKLRVDDNLDRYLDVGVEGDTLRIALKRVSSVSDATLQATVTAPSLAQIQGSGSSRVHLQNRLAADELRVELSGASRLDGPVDSKSATAAVSGASQVELSGRAASLNASASGASHLLLQQLQVDALDVSLSGASNAEVSVRRTISASLSGASSLRYRGSPTFTKQDLSGSSSVTRVA